ncbi:MAG: hypothetical protein ACRDYF_14595 [Acidimicrobiia bacterium]
MFPELRAKHTGILRRDHLRERGAWVVLLVSALGLSAFLWNHGRFDLDIYLDAARGWPDHLLYETATLESDCRSTTRRAPPSSCCR